MQKDNLQQQRLELKYIIHEQVALAVRDYVHPYLTLDKFGEGNPDFSYPLHSLYLDSEQLTLYWHTINGDKNRYKLRLRYYDESPTSPVFFEIKRRMNNAILKQRGGVRRTAVASLLAGGAPQEDEVISDEPKHRAALDQFSRLMRYHAAIPTAHVSYRREAWISPHNNSVRVTMDRQIQLDPEPTGDLKAAMNNPVAVFGNNVVLELKFTGRFPDWFKEMTRHFGLQQCSAAKYADGLTLLSELGREMRPPLQPETFAAAENQQNRRAFLETLRERSEPVFS